MAGLTFNDMVLLSQGIRMDSIPPRAFTGIRNTLERAGVQQVPYNLSDIATIAASLRETPNTAFKEVANALTSEIRASFLPEDREI